MFYEYKNFDGINNSVIEITSSDSAFGLLKRSGNENIKVCLPLDLCIGKLPSLKPFNRNNLKLYHGDENSYNFTDEFNNLKKFVKNSLKIRVWSSHLDSSDYCLLLLICFLFRDKEISVIFSEEINQSPQIGMINASEIPNIEKREHILTKSQKENYCKEWEQIVSDNKELRCMINGKVISCTIDSFDDEILDRLEKSGEIYISKFTSDLMGNPTLPHVIFSEFVYVYLINRLEKIGKIKSTLINHKRYIKINKKAYK